LLNKPSVSPQAGNIMQLLADLREGKHCREQRSDLPWSDARDSADSLEPPDYSVIWRRHLLVPTAAPKDRARHHLPPRAIDKVQAKAGECPALHTLRDQPSGVGTGEASGVRGMPALSGTKPICRRRGEQISFLDT
jgi:hypothetical protein